MSDRISTTLSRRALIKSLAATSAGACLLRTIAAETPAGEKISSKMVAQAEWISGLKLNDQQRELLVQSLNDADSAFATLRAIPLPADGPVPALLFEPSPHRPAPEGPVDVQFSAPHEPRPQSDAELAFLPLHKLGALIRDREISSTELTKLYLARLKKYDPKLFAVVSLTEELALKQAARADEELSRGQWRGPLHGVPYGAKDLLAVPGYPTTWGAGPYRDQKRDVTATVVRRLEQAGAVLLCKTTLGELAWGDEWFGGKTRSPWDTNQGSSGSSAGTGATVAAGLVGFGIGSETWGSIVSPSTRCGISGLRPTFGRVSRFGAMALSWSMDKLGPMARAVDDLPLVLGAIAGSDGLDPVAKNAAFRWPYERDVRSLKIGVIQEQFDADYTAWADSDENKDLYRQWQKNDLATLEHLRGLGLQLTPIPFVKTPLAPLSNILNAEAATAFDDLTRSGRDALLKRQVANAWPTVFRAGQMMPAVEYIRANRIRSILMAEWEQTIASFDLYISPSYSDNQLLTNLTGHPQVVLCNGFRSDKMPTSICFTGRLYGESAALAVAKLYQSTTDWHLKRPAGFD